MKRLIVPTKTTYLIFICLSFYFFITSCQTAVNTGDNLILNDSSYFEKPGLNVLVFSNWYNGYFSDSKMSGVEIIHHGVRTVTNGDVRLQPTPEQWDPIPQFVDRSVDRENSTITASLKYPDYNFSYNIKAVPNEDGIVIRVILDEPLPEKLEGRAGFNLEFLPSAYFEKTYLMDGNGGTFPLYPSGPMEVRSNGNVQPKPIARGSNLVLAPEDPQRRITINGLNNELMLYDGRNKAQNGWYVVRSLIPSDKAGEVIKWQLKANTIPNWKRKPVITHSQVGYHPEQNKTAVIELDKNDAPLPNATLFKVEKNGDLKNVHEANAPLWGYYLRYKYLTFDFSDIKEPGIYVIQYGNQQTKPFRISKDVYQKAWHPTLDVYFPVQMDHMFVNEAYRVWHGQSHMDDALQAPVDHEHFDLYAQGPTTDTPYEPGEHIPGLNVGGWYDAGDYDIRTQTQYYVVSNLVMSWENFGLDRDETTIDQEAGYVDIHDPDGKPDLLQQIEHGAKALLAQHKAVGHAIAGIIVPHISQYTHLGDGLTMTDNLIYSSKLDSLESDGFRSGTFDDRWAFTSKSTPLNYGSAAALAAASRALNGYNDPLAMECLETAKNVWEEEHSHEPDIFYNGNTTGGPLKMEELKAAVELLITTQDQKYAQHINESWPYIKEHFNYTAILAVRALPYIGEDFKNKMRESVENYKNEVDKIKDKNPFGVPISTGGWAGNGGVIGFGMTNYMLHKAFPDIIDSEFVYKALNYIYGTHPGSNISFVSGVGTHSKKVAYGMNRADYSFIAGGIVPGTLILPPDYPENKEDWPFLWGENEYVISVGSSYIFLVNAANELLDQEKNEGN